MKVPAFPADNSSNGRNCSSHSISYRTRISNGYFPVGRTKPAVKHKGAIHGTNSA
jgi:hypothetical protein